MGSSGIKLLSGIKQLYFCDRPIAVAENCTISCDTASEGSKDWRRIVPTYLLAFRLKYGVSDWLEWRDGLFKRFWYDYIPKPVWESVEEEIAKYEEKYSKQMDNG